MIDNSIQYSLQISDFVRQPCAISVVRDPWLATSALQKSIRRGATEDALRAASVLLDIRPDRLWRRLAVIAFEDIGLGDLDLVTQVAWVSGKRAWRRDHGGDWRIAAFLVTRLASAAKSRDACDVLSIADWHPALADDRLRFLRAPKSELIETITDERSSLPVRALAGWYLAGTANHRGENLPLRKGQYADLAAVYTDLQVSPAVLQAASLGAARTCEALALPLIWLAFQNSSWRKIRRDRPPNSAYIGGWPAAAWDKHTRPGKRALHRFASECVALRRFLHGQIPQRERLEFVGALVFRAEGSCLDARLTYEGADALLHMAHEAQLCWASLPFDAYPEALEIVRSSFDQLNAIRREIAAGWLAPE